MTGFYVNNVSFEYPNGTKALNDISLMISPGEVIGILGANGAGKSTFIKILNGLLNPTEGTIFVDDKISTEYKSEDLTKIVGLMFQNPDHQLFSSTVEEEIEFSLKNLELSENKHKEYKNDIVKTFNLEPLLNKSPYNLSGGERKRVSMATILCRKPKYMLFDEPTTGQDKKYRQKLSEIINEEQREDKIIIIVSHDTEFVYNNTQRVLIFEQGRILADGPTKKVLSNEYILTQSSIIPPQILRLVNELENLWKEEKRESFPFDIQNIGTYNEFMDFLIEHTPMAGRK
ncbi:MAG: ATP-binding cassette domain-containing protein [Candidatus Lokiarchaeota archaeon]|nr:ATP-binding cassette domain-containing protein [Candidatus Lokiarchaeota archaeon]